MSKLRSSALSEVVGQLVVDNASQVEYYLGSRYTRAGCNDIDGECYMLSIIHWFWMKVDLNTVRSTCNTKRTM